ncbi:MAG: hypothetical protein WBG70_24270, partial [Spirulinaceae cyanobacterium]
GQSQSVITINNTSDQPFRARVYAEPFTYSRDDGFQVLETTPSDLTPYLQFSPRELNVEPGQARKVRIITRFPPSLPTGEYRAVIFTENLRETIDDSGNNVTIETRIGTTIYVRQGNVSPQLEAVAASWDKEQQQLQILINNSGDASARTGVNWTLQQGEKMIAEGILLPVGIVATSERNLSLSSETDKQLQLTSGTYQLTGDLLWGNQENPESKSFSLDLIVP